VLVCWHFFELTKRVPEQGLPIAGALPHKGALAYGRGAARCLAAKAVQQVRGRRMVGKCPSLMALRQPSSAAEAVSPVAREPVPQRAPAPARD